MGFNWESASTNEIIVLYEAIKNLLRPKSLTWKQVFAEASPNIEIGTDYERNFRRGKIAPRRARQIFEWLERRFPETAAYVDELLTSVHTAIDTDAPWERFIDEYGQFTGVELRVIRIEERFRPHHEIHGKIDAEEMKRLTAQYELKLHTRFTFRIESPFRGAMCVLQWSRGVWWPIPLRPLTCLAEIRQGTHWVPFNPDDDDGRQPRLLTEHTEDGLHRLVFLLTKVPHSLLTDADPQQRFDPDRLNQLADAYRAEPTGSWQLLRLNVLFKALDAP